MVPAVEPLSLDSKSSTHINMFTIGLNIATISVGGLATRVENTTQTNLRTSGSSNSSVPQAALLGCLMQIGKQVPELAWILDAQERHLVTGNESLRIGQVLAERVVVPGDIGVLHRRRVGIAGHAARLAPNQAVQAGANHVLPGFEAMADLALIEYLRPALSIARALGLRDQSEQQRRG